MKLSSLTDNLIDLKLQHQDYWNELNFSVKWSLQDKEAHLDIIMDRMRQDAAEKALKDSLTRALEMLEKIRLAYVYFLVMQFV